MGGARLYRSQTARVNAPVRPLIASGPQFHLLVRGANLEPVRIRTGPGSGPIRGLRRHTVRQASHVDEIKGQQLYQMFNKTIRLTQIMRQQGDDPISIQFQQTLSELRENKLSQEGWGFLCTRVANQLSSAELASMDNALRLYFTKAEVHERNSTKLAALNWPIKKISARHTARKAAKASEEEADNLSAEIYVVTNLRSLRTRGILYRDCVVPGCLTRKYSPTILDLYRSLWDKSVLLSGLLEGKFKKRINCLLY